MGVTGDAVLVVSPQLLACSPDSPPCVGLVPPLARQRSNRETLTAGDCGCSMLSREPAGSAEHHKINRLARPGRPHRPSVRHLSPG